MPHRKHVVWDNLHAMFLARTAGPLICALMSVSAVLHGDSSDAKAGGLLVESEPIGATVFIDGHLAGETPLTLPEIAAGVHRVRIVRLGYLENSRVVTVEAGHRATVRARLTAPAPPTAQTPALRIIVIEGEGAVNIVQQKTAVAPIVEVRDRNDQPVAGAVVRFAIRSGRASFGGGRTLSVTTNAAGRATANGLTPLGKGTIRIAASSIFQGQTATVTIAQANVMTAAEAATAASSAGGGGGGGAASGGMSIAKIGIIAGAAGGGAVVAAQQLQKKGPVRVSGIVFATATFGTSCPDGVLDMMTCFKNPVSGAVVSTSIDSTTTTTDGRGFFLLTTTVSKSDFDGCRPYTLTITAAGLPTYSISAVGNDVGNGRGDQMFSLSPRVPESMGCNSTR